MTTSILGSGWKGMQLSQERIVFLIAAIIFVAFSIFLNNFLEHRQYPFADPERLDSRHPRRRHGARVIGRGIDLSLVSLMAMSVAWTLQPDRRRAFAAGAAIGLAFSRFVGAVNGGSSPMSRSRRSSRRSPWARWSTASAATILVDLDVDLPPGRPLVLWIGRARCSACLCPIYPLRRRLPRRPISSCATRSPAAISAPWATTCSPRASPAFRCGR